MDPNKIALNLLSTYIEYVQQEQFTKDDEFAKAYIFVLRIREWQLKRRLLNKPVSLDSLATLKTGHRAAEKLYLDYDLDDGSKVPAIRELSEILHSVANEFHGEIVKIESHGPHPSAEFFQSKFAHYANLRRHSGVQGTEPRHPHRIKCLCHLSKRRALSPSKN